MKRERNAFRVMHRRCLEPNFKDFWRYGGAGITISPRWLNEFAQFIEDMGPAPTGAHWLGRLDVTGDYTQENTIWTTHDPQVRRRQYCHRVEVGGQTMTPTEAARLPGQPTGNSVLRRAQAGYNLDQHMPRIDKRSSWLTYQGETLPLPEWARRIGLPRRALWMRIKQGWPIERALTTPIQSNPNRK
jgi:hypothetical protein